MVIENNHVGYKSTPARRLGKIYLGLFGVLLIIGLALTAYTFREVPQFDVIASGPGFISDTACLDGTKFIDECNVELFFDVDGNVIYDIDTAIAREPSFWQIICVSDDFSGSAFSIHEWTNTIQIPDGPDRITDIDIQNPSRDFDISFERYNTPAENIGVSGDADQCGIFNFSLNLSDPEVQFLQESLEDPASSYQLDRTVIFDVPDGTTTISFKSFDIGEPRISRIVPVETALRIIEVDSFKQVDQFDLLTVWLTIGGIIGFVLITSIFPFKIANDLEATLDKEQKSRQAYIKLSPDPLAMLDESGVILQASDTLRELSGYEHLEHSKIFELFVDANHNSENIQDMLDDSHAFFDTDKKRLLKTSDDRIVPVEINLNTIHFFGRDVTMMRISDIRDSIKARQAMAIEAQRDHALLISKALHHETNRGVTKLTEWFPIWMETKDSESEYAELAKKYVYEALEELPRAIRTTTALSLLGISQFIDESELQELNVKDICANVQDLDILVECCGEGTLLGSKDLLLLAVRNIIKNAKIHGGAHKVTIALENDLGDNKSVLSIADDGGGSSQLEANAAIQGGIRTSGNGTGEGLKIVQRVIAAHRADMKVTAAPGEGWQFEITFPYLRT